MKRRLAHLVAASLLSISGCALLATGRDGLLNQNEPLQPEQIADFENQHPVRKVIRLETSIVSALSTDRRIRELAWEELDESGLMSPEDRRRLNQSGIRVGVAGGNLPWAVSSLLRGERIQQPQGNEQNQIRNSESHSSSFGSHVAIPEGGSSMIEFPNDEQALIIPPGKIAGMYNGIELANARCVLQMTATEYGDGWVVVRFLPQIHHGAMAVRYSVTDGGQQMPTRQKINPLYEQQFELKLHTHETVVIGYQKHDEWTVGRLMFQSDTLSSRSERLVVLHLKQIEEVKGRKAVTVNYHKY